MVWFLVWYLRGTVTRVTYLSSVSVTDSINFILRTLGVGHLVERGYVSSI